VVQKYDVLITPTLVEVMRKSTQDGVRKQFLPGTNELHEAPHELADPIGDGLHEKVKGLIHRYPDRCLLKIVSVCPVYCRFCFRKEMIGPKTDALTQQDLNAIYDYIRAETGIWEVILSGGDPFILKPNRLASILTALTKINHVKVIRIHTRVPIVDPA